MTKIVIVTDAWSPQVNGVVRTLTMTIAELKKRGFEVDVVSPEQFRTVALPFYPEIRLALPPYRLKERLSSAQAIHIATEGPLGLAARSACVRAGLPFTTAFHTNFPFYLEGNLGIPQALTMPFFRWFHRYSQAVMVPTKSMKDALDAAGFTNTRLWGRGVDSTLFRPRSDDEIAPENRFPAEWARPFWLNVGRVSGEKNLEAFLTLDLPGTKIVIGDGPDLTRLVKDYPEVKFLGQKSGIALAQSYNQADVFVFPSKSDTFGLVNIEAIASGIPVAAYPVTGPLDIVKSKETGFLSENLKEACISCLNIATVSETFSWEAATDQFAAGLAVMSRGST